MPLFTTKVNTQHMFNVMHLDSKRRNTRYTDRTKVALNKNHLHGGGEIFTCAIELLLQYVLEETATAAGANTLLLFRQRYEALIALVFRFSNDFRSHRRHRWIGSRRSSLRRAVHRAPPPPPPLHPVLPRPSAPPCAHFLFTLVYAMPLSSTKFFCRWHVCCAP